MIDLHHQLGGRDDAILIIQMPRELNHESAEPLRAAVARHLPNRDGAGLILDMADVAMVSSIGIAALLQVQELCRDRGASLVLVKLPPRQQAFLKMLKLERKFPSTDTIEEALAILEPK